MKQWKTEQTSAIKSYIYELDTFSVLYRNCFHFQTRYFYHDEFFKVRSFFGIPHDQIKQIFIRTNYYLSHISLVQKQALKSLLKLT